MKVIFVFLVLITAISCFPSYAHANLFINEVSTYDSDDWVEIYNDGQESINLSGYILRDTTGSNKKELTGTINPNGFYVLDFSNYLNKANDTVRLLKLENGNEVEISKLVYGEVNSVCAPDSVSQSIGMVTDGGNTIERFSTSTKGITNNGSALLPCPTPTPDPTSTPTKTPTLTPNPTFTLTLTPTKIPTKTPTVTLAPTEAIVEESDDNADKFTKDSQVIGVTDELGQEDGSKKENPSSKTTYAPIFLIGSGVFFITASIYVMVSKKRTESKQ
jgi:Lamin Tail Domain